MDNEEVENPGRGRGYRDSTGGHNRPWGLHDMTAGFSLDSLQSWGGTLLRRLVGKFVVVRSEEFDAVIHSFSGFFFLLMAYFVLLPLRDEAGMSLGTGALPVLFILSLVATVIAAPASSALLAHPDLPKSRALLLLYRFFALSLVVFFFFYLAVPTNSRDEGKVKLSEAEQQAAAMGAGSLAKWADTSLAFLAVRGSFFLWVSLLNLFAMSAMWARLADIMSSEAGARLFGFVGAGATLGQLVGSLLTAYLARLGPGLLLVSALLMELAARSVANIRAVASTCHMASPPSASPAAPRIPSSSPRQARRRSRVDNPLRDPSGSETAPLIGPTAVEETDQWARGGEADSSDHHQGRTGDGEQQQNQNAGGEGSGPKSESSIPPSSVRGTGVASLWEGLHLIVASGYLLHVCLFLLLNAVISSFFYFERSAIVAGSVVDPVARRVLFAQINGLSAATTVVFQLTLTGRLLSYMGVAAAISMSPAVALLGISAISIWPSALVVGMAEASRKVVNYCITRPGREILFTVVTREEKYKAKVCIDTLVQRLGDALAAGAFRVLGTWLLLGPSQVALYAIPLCAVWLFVAFNLGRRQQALAKLAPLPREP